MKLSSKLTLLLLSTSLAPFALAQQSQLQNSRPLIFAKPMPLNWKSVTFDSIDYNQLSYPGNISLYTLPDATALRFNLKVVFPYRIFSDKPEVRTTYGAMADLLILGGFGNLSFEEVQNTLSANGISLDTSLNQNGQVVISASGLSKDFNLTFSLVKELITAPQFDNKSLKIWKQENHDKFTNLMDANTLEKQMRIMDNQANLLAFGPDHYFSGSLSRISPEAIDKVDINKVKELYTKVLNKNGMSIWLSGHYSQANVSALGEFAQTLPSAEPPVTRWLPARNLQNNQETKIQTLILKKPEMTQSNILFRYFFPNQGKLNPLEEAQWAILSEIFSSTGGVVGNDRFSKAMRADSGLSYAPFAYFNGNIVYPNTNLSGFYMAFQSPNERLDEAVLLAKKTWTEFLNHGITQEELDNCRTALMNRLLATEQTVFNKGNDIMGQVFKGNLPEKNPVETSLASLNQVQDVTPLNALLKKMSQQMAQPVLVIMGDPSEKEISLLSSDKDFNLVKVIPYSSFLNSI